MYGLFNFKFKLATVRRGTEAGFESSAAAKNESCRRLYPSACCCRHVSHVGLGSGLPSLRSSLSRPPASMTSVLEFSRHVIHIEILRHQISFQSFILETNFNVEKKGDHLSLEICSKANVVIKKVLNFILFQFCGSQ